MARLKTLMDGRDLSPAPQHICLAYQERRQAAQVALGRGDLRKACVFSTQAHQVALRAAQEGMWIPGQERSPLIQKSLGVHGWSPVGDGSRSVGVFAPLPRSLAARLPDLAPHDMSPSHMTVLYIGSVPPEQQDNVMFAIEHELSTAFASNARAVGFGEFSGHGRGDASYGEGYCCYARIEVEQHLRDLRSRLYARLVSMGVGVNDLAGGDPSQWVPHVTLAYPGPREVFDTSSVDLAPLRWSVDRLEVWGMPRIISVQLQQPAGVFGAVGRYLRSSEVELPEQLASVLMEALSGALKKGAGHKYLRRVPYTDAKGQRRYRYYYSVGGGRGLAHKDEFKVNAAFKVPHAGKEGHFHVVEVEGDKLTIEHDESGHRETLTAQALSALLRSHHAEAIADHKSKTLASLDAAKKHGSKRQLQRQQALAERYGYKDGGRNAMPPSYNPEVAPSFLHLNKEAIGYKRFKDGKFWRASMDMDIPELKAMGFYDAMAGFRGDFFPLSFVLSNQGNEEPSQKQLKLLRAFNEDYELWWSGLGDEQRELFWLNYYDHQSYVGDERPDNADDGWETSDVLEIPPGMEKMTERGYKPHGYQARAVNFVKQRAKGKALLAMEMGLGKTMTALLLFHHLKAQGEVKKMIVSSPINALGSWRKHLTQFSDARWAIVTGTPKRRQKLFEQYQRGELDVLVITTDAVKNDAQQLKEAIGSRADLAHTLRVVDEVHKFKNPKAQRTEVLRDILGGDNDGYVVGMTGTVKPNKGEDFFEVCQNVRPGALGRNKWAFADRYCHIIDGYKKSIGGFRDEALGYLREDTKNFIFTRTTSDKDVNLALPRRNDLVDVLEQDKTAEKLTKYLAEAAVAYQRAHSPRLSEEEREQMYGHNSAAGQFNAHNDYFGQMDAGMGGARINLKSEDAYLQRLRQAGAAALEAKRKSAKGLEAVAYRDDVIPRNAMGLMMRLRQLAVSPRALHPSVGEHVPASYESPKISHCADGVVEHLENNPDKGAVVFGFYKEGLSLFQESLKRRGIDPAQVGYIDGSMSSSAREKLCDDLNSGRIKVLVAQRNSMQEGANLQHRANMVVHLDTPYEPASLTQSTARVYRQGQKHITTVMRPISGGIESKIEAAVAAKLVESAKALGKAMDSEAALYASIEREGGEDFGPQQMLEMLGIEPSIFGAMPKKEVKDAA